MGEKVSMTLHSQSKFMKKDFELTCSTVIAC